MAITYHRMTINCHRMTIHYHILAINYHRMAINYHRIAINYHRMAINYHRMAINNHLKNYITFAHGGKQKFLSFQFANASASNEYFLPSRLRKHHFKSFCELQTSVFIHKTTYKLLAIIICVEIH
jgi:hypothetical protein